MLYQLILFLITLAFVVRAQAAGTIGLPFGPGQTWTVCMGYNALGVHKDNPVLDLVIDPNSAGQNGCIYNPAVSSAGREVLAPDDGYLSKHTSNTDGVCIDLDDGGAIDLLHLVNRKENGRVTKGQVIGKVAGPTNSNNGIPHIHMQLRKDMDKEDCKEPLVPFVEANDGRFQYHDDLPCDTFEEGKCGGRTNQHSGTKLSNPAASTWHPAGTLIRAVDDYKVYFLQGGKRQWVYDETTFNAAKFRWEEVIVVSAQERNCYQEGTTLYPQTFSFPSWNGYRMGTLVRKTGTDPVYVVGEDGMLHHLNITEAQFISFGYNASMIRDLSSVGNIGTPLTASSFQQCQKNLPPTPPPTCTYTLTPTSAFFKGEGGEGNIAVTTQTGCTWNIQYRPSWFEPTGASSGTGNGNIDSGM